MDDENICKDDESLVKEGHFQVVYPIMYIQYPNSTMNIRMHLH